MPESIEVDIRKAMAALKDLSERRLKFAIMRGINKTVDDVARAERRAIDQVFDRPTPTTQKAVLFKKADHIDNIQGRVYLRDEATKGTPPVKYLRAEVEGGGRRSKRWERAVAAKLPGMGEVYLMPAKAALGVRTDVGGMLDQYGNIKNGIITRILSHIRANPDPYQNQTPKSKKRARKRKLGQFYLFGPGNKWNLESGIYWRGPEGKLIPIFFVSKQPQYRSRFDFHGIARQTTAQVADKNVSAEITQAIERAKGSV
jgi:hypothetical protein